MQNEQKQEKGSAPGTAEDIGDEIRAELKALNVPVITEVMAGHPLSYFQVSIDKGVKGRVSVYERKVDYPSGRALLVAWVQAECQRRGWDCICYAFHDGNSVDVRKPTSYHAMKTIGEAEHPTSLPLAALRAFRQAVEAEVQP